LRNNNHDSTLKKNYQQKYQFLVHEYELVKAKKHPQYRFVKDFYKAHGTCPQTFLKYYGRFKASGGDLASFIPQKRGPRWQTRRTAPDIEEQVLAARALGNNRYDIVQELRPVLGDQTPAASTVYNILCRHGVNRLNRPMKEEKRRIIKQRSGELGHIDTHHLSRDLVAGEPKKRYLVSVIDAYSRVAWAELVDDIKSLTVMFATMRCFQQLTHQYGVRFEEVLTDNGPEFGPKGSTSKESHPFERLLMEMGIKHRYIRPYRPQTNGKIERFWRTLNEDLIEGTYFEDRTHFENELTEYLVYYNQARAHQGIGGKTPASMIENPSTN